MGLDGYDSDDGFVVDDSSGAESYEASSSDDENSAPSPRTQQPRHSKDVSDYAEADLSSDSSDGENQKLWCSACERLKHVDDFSRAQQKKTSDDCRYCLIHTSGDQSRYVERLQSRIRQNESDGSEAEEENVHVDDTPKTGNLRFGFWYFRRGRNGHGRTNDEQESRAVEGLARLDQAVARFEQEIEQRRQSLVDTDEEEEHASENSDSGEEEQQSETEDGQEEDEIYTSKYENYADHRPKESSDGDSANGELSEDEEVFMSPSATNKRQRTVLDDEDNSDSSDFGTLVTPHSSKKRNKVILDDDDDDTSDGESSDDEIMATSRVVKRRRRAILDDDDDTGARIELEGIFDAEKER